MRHRLVRHLAAACVAAALGASLGGAASSDPAERTSSLADQERVNVTIYNGDLALVHDRRHVALDAGTSRIAWRDVSGNMDATSAIVEDLTVPGAVSVVEQNFDFDLLKPDTLLAKYVGRQVTVVHDKPAPGRPERETATLLANNDGVVLQYADRVETGLYESHIVYPSIPDNLRDRPTLVLDLATQKAATQDLDLSYITGGLGWHADYVGVVSPDETRMDLSGLVTLTNTTGTTFRDAHLQLVAGRVNAPPPSHVQFRTIGAVRARAAAPMQEENYFEYHLYTLPATTTIANAQTKQVALLSAHDVPVRKTLELRGSESYYSNADADLGAKLPIGVFVTFTNKGGELGIPLPGGLVRLYKNDTHGTSQFLGADAIDHTPRNEDVRLHVGDSFDVTANKKQTDFKIVGCAYDSAYDVRVANAKDTAQDVDVVEPLPGDWEILSESLPHRKTSSATATWTLHVPPNGSTTLTYRARVKFCG